MANIDLLTAHIQDILALAERLSSLASSLADTGASSAIGNLINEIADSAEFGLELLA